MTQIAPAPSPLAAPLDTPLADVPTRTVDAPVVPLQPSRVPYHRMARALANHRWWRPLAVSCLSLFAYVGIVVMALIPLVIAGLADPRVMEWMDQPVSSGEVDLHDPATFIVSFGMIALMYPAVALGVRVGGGRRPGTLSSVAGRLRWRLLAQSVVVACAVMLTFQGLAIAWNVVVGGETLSLTWDGVNVPLLVAALAIVPFQAAAEEYVFRGLPQQLIGTWLRSPWWGILLPLPLFVAGHVYDWRGLTDVAVFALAAGILTWRTGGLEAAIGLHVVNNVFGAVLGALGVVDLNATAVPTSAMVISLTATAVYTVVILRHAPQVTRPNPA